ncbi:hypothetical protein ES703_23905 [subsurface metagenome]
MRRADFGLGAFWVDTTSSLEEPNILGTKRVVFLALSTGASGGAGLIARQHLW